MPSSRTFTVLLLLAGTARADEPNPFLQQAKSFYEQVKYEKCAQRLEQAVQWKSTAAELVEIELYAGLCQFNLNALRDAREHFELALKLNPAATLPPYSPPKAVSLFKSIAQARPVEEVAPPVEHPAEEPPPPEAVAAAPAEVASAAPPPPPPPTLVPSERALPPAAATEVFRPVPKLTIGLGVGAGVAAGVGTFLIVQAQAQARDANRQVFEQVRKERGDEAVASATAAYVSLGAAVSAAAGAVIVYLLEPTQRR